MEIRKITRKPEQSDDLVITTFNEEGFFDNDVIPSDPAKAAPIQMRIIPDGAWENVFCHIADAQVRPYPSDQEYVDRYGSEAAEIKAIDQLFYEHYREIIRGERTDFWLVSVEFELGINQVTLQYATPKSGCVCPVVLFLPEQDYVEDEDGAYANRQLALEFRAPRTQTGLEPVYRFYSKGTRKRVIVEQLAPDHHRVKEYNCVRNSVTIWECTNV